MNNDLENKESWWYNSEIAGRHQKMVLHSIGDGRWDWGRLFPTDSILTKGGSQANVGGVLSRSLTIPPTKV